MTLLVVEVAQIIPYTGSNSVQNSAKSLTIPLTFFDLPWLVVRVLPPPKKVFFYRLNECSQPISLSPAASPGTKTSSSRISSSLNDPVLVTIAETDADFSHLSSYGQRQVSELHTLTPELPFSNDSVSAFSLQITLFPNQGFSIGYTAHHAVVDGKTLSMFMKAWAQLCKQEIENRVISLPQSLTTSLDRSFVKDLTRVEEQMMEIVRSLINDDKTNMRNLTAGETGDDVVLATLVLSCDDVERLRERVRRSDSSHVHLSTFVIAYAYVWTCLVKARGGDGDRAVSLAFLGDFRTRLEPPIPATYFGNCVFAVGSYKRKAAEFTGAKGFVTAVEILSDLVKSLSSPGMVETFAQEFANAFRFSSIGESSQFGSVAGSNRFGVYEMDFGWGRPVKVDVISIRGEAISMADRRDESGGVEIGMCINKTEMDIVFSLFNHGL